MGPGPMGPGMGPGPGGPPPNPMFTDVEGEVWIEYKNDQGRPYYYNCKTQKTVWTKPKIKEEGLFLQIFINSYSTNMVQNCFLVV